MPIRRKASRWALIGGSAAGQLSMVLAAMPVTTLPPWRAGGLTGQRGQRGGDLRQAGLHVGRGGSDLAAAVGVAGVGACHGIPEVPLDPGPVAVPLAQGVRAVRAVRRRPWQGELPVARLAAASFPKLVISGAHSPAFEAVCDALAGTLQARRAHVNGAGHATPETGDAFNQVLEAFIGTASRGARVPDQEQRCADDPYRST